MAGAPVSCPVCGKPGGTAYRPFCSRRCADVDLGRWFNEDYRIPAEEADEADGQADDEQEAEEGEDSGDGVAENPRGALAHCGAAGGLARPQNL